MCQYTTGEIAKKCGVSVRTVQYYDSRGILVPQELSTGGRRLYNDADIRRLGTITFLRELGFSITNIKELLDNDQTGDVIDSLIGEQETQAMDDLRGAQERLARLVELRKTLHTIKTVDEYDFHAISDAKLILSDRKQLKGVYRTLIILGIIMDAIEVGTLVYSIMSHNWWVFGVGMVLVVCAGIWLSQYYWKNTAYLCPSCHTVFRPRFVQAFFAAHTPTTRKLTCPHCGYRGFCVEVSSERLTDQDEQ